MRRPSEASSSLPLLRLSSEGDSAVPSSDWYLSGRDRRPRREARLSGALAFGEGFVGEEEEDDEDDADAGADADDGRADKDDENEEGKMDDEAPTEAFRPRSSGGFEASSSA
jgi:hypothetical protein